MTNQISIYDHKTGETVVREMTKDELSQAAEYTIASEQTQKMIADMATAKQAVLDKLGLTADEAAALLG
jgi:hypothetical protein